MTLPGAGLLGGGGDAAGSVKGVAKSVSAEALKRAVNSLCKHFALVFVLVLVLLPSTIIIISQRKRGAQASTRNSIPCRCAMVGFVGAPHRSGCVSCFAMDGRLHFFCVCVGSSFGEK